MAVRIATEKAPAAIGPYSQAIVHGGIVYTSGQIPIDPVTGRIDAPDISGQTAQVCRNLRAVLEAAGSSPEHVLKTTCFLRDMADFAAFNAVYETFFPNAPARSTVAVRELPRGALVEIEAIAAIVAIETIASIPG